MLKHYKSPSKGYKYVLFPQLIWPQNLFRKSVNFIEGQSLGNNTSGTLSNVWPFILKGKMRYEIVDLFHYGTFHVIFPICFIY